MSKQLLVAIDPGFDSIKVVVNGQNFKFPFNAVETDERKMSDYGERKGFILYKDRAGATWRVGQYARGFIFDNKIQDEDGSDLSGFYTEDRFVSDEFIVGIRSALAMAINKSGNYDLQDQLDIRVIVALPHAIRTKYASTIIGLVAGEHDYFVTFDSEEERTYHFTIQDGNVFTASQTIAAILGETSDDDGYINEEKFFYLSDGPTLVIDGGYYTVGLVPVSRGGSVDDAKAESDIQFAMKNVNVAAARAIQEKRPDIKHYMIEYLMEQNNGLIRYLENGKVETIDLCAIRATKMRETCDAFIKYLDAKYNSLLDFRYVLVTGGTGACYFEQLLRHYTEIGLMDDKHMLLTKPSVGGNEMSIEFAIAAGAYKGLCGKIRA